MPHPPGRGTAPTAAALLLPLLLLTTLTLICRLPSERPGDEADPA